MIEPRSIDLEPGAAMALAQILGIMSDQLFGVKNTSGWDTEHLIDLDARLAEHEDGQPFVMGIDDAALLLEGMAFTEIMSADLPWIDMVRWTTDFVTEELRQHWTEEQWQAYSAR
jgi:hypothetical protein